MATIDKVRRGLRRLNAEQLQAVADFIDLLLVVDEDEELSQDQDQDQDQETRGGGWVEEKYIRGYGPYAYWRWRDGKRLRSKYLGKVERG